MTRAVIGATAAFAIACAAALSAQTGSPNTSQSGNTVTVTGCLQHGDMSSSSAGTTTGTTGTTPSSSSSRSEYLLNNAVMGSGSSTTGTGTTGTGTTSSATSSGSGSSYVLDGKSDELSKHVGEKVEVTGRIEAGSSSGYGGTGTTGTGTTSGTSASSSSAGAHQHVRVESVRMIAASCSSR